MAKKIECELWVGTQTKFFKWGEFESISATKQYVRDCITCYHKIVPKKVCKESTLKKTEN